jgi:hypothetical protein
MANSLSKTLSRENLGLFRLGDEEDDVEGLFMASRL